MAKIYGLFGSMTGKLADIVMSVRNGEQIARKYQPIVSNPNTPAQVAARAKLKLLSQLSAVMASVIAFRSEGPVSARNKFVKKNYAATTYADNEADIELVSVDITGGILNLPPVIASQSEGTLSIALGTAAEIPVDKVVYVVFAKQSDGTLRLFGSRVVNEAGASNDWATTMPFSSSLGGVAYAYGVRYNTEAARTIFGKLNIDDAESIAKLMVTRNLLESDITLTETKSILIAPTNA